MYEEGTLDRKIRIAIIIIVGLAIIGLLCLFIFKPIPKEKSLNTKYMQVGDSYKLDLSELSKIKNLKFLSSNENIVSINKNGEVEAKEEGNASIEVKDKKHTYIKGEFVVEQTAGKIPLELDKSVVEIEKDKTFDYKTNIVDFDKLGETLIYKIKNEKIAEVDENGVITGKKDGSTIITVKVKGKQIQVQGRISVNDPSLKEEKEDEDEEVIDGESEKGEGDKEVIDESKNNSSQKPSTGGSSSNTTSNSKPSSNKSGSTTVSPTGLSLNRGGYQMYYNYPKGSGNTVKYTATVYPSNANKTVRWASSNPNVASVNSSGLVTAKNVGNATISATTSNGIKRTAVVTVRAIATGISISVPGGIKSTGFSATNSYVLTGTITPASSYFKNVTWTSGNIGIATISTRSANTATLTVRKPGTTLITARVSNNPLYKAVSRTVTVYGLQVRVWLSGSTIYERTKSSISYSYKKSRAINYKITSYPNSNAIPRNNLSVSSSNTKVLSCSSSSTNCTMKGKGTATLKFTYTKDKSYSTYITVNVT